VEENVLVRNERSGADRQSQVERPPNLHAEKVCGRDSDDLELVIGQRQLAPDDVRGPAVFALPELVAYDQARRAAAPLIFWRREAAAQRSLTAQRIEKVAPHPKHSRRTRLTALSEVDAVWAPGEDAGKGLLPRSDLFPNRIGDRWRPPESPPRPLHIREANFGQFLRRSDR